MMEFITSFWNVMPVTFAQSLIIAFVVMGIMLPFRILGFPDLTSEGAFPLGGCVCAVLLVAGVHPGLAMIAAAAAGFLAGCTTAWIHLRFRINTLLAGILVMTMLYSINLRIMGRTNIALFTHDSIFKWLDPAQANSPIFKIIVVGLMVAIVFAIGWYFFSTERGVTVRAAGAGPDMAAAQGINVWTATIVGVGAGGAFAALGGSIMVQSQGFADVNMGLGILINGLASLIIGESIVGRSSVLRQLVAPIVGAAVYYQLVSLCLTIGLKPADLKLATGLFVLVMLGLPQLRAGKSGAVPEQEKVRE